MKQSAKSVTFTGLAGAVAVAGASQAYGTIINVAPPTNITGNNTATFGREYWNALTGTTSATRPTAFSLQFGYENGTLSNGNTLFYTAVHGGTGGASTANYYYAGNAKFFAYGITKGATIGTGGTYASFGQSATYFTVLGEVYKGNTASIFPINQVSYLGFQFLGSDNALHDGWVELENETYTSAANPGGLIFLAAAYNSVADTAAGGTIAAGQAGTNAVPEPGTLGALAMGAAALAGVGLKRRQAARAARQA